MKIVRAFGQWFLYSGVLTLLCHCGLVTYPGQPGVVTNGYSKIDIEYLEEPGLFVYEVIYDNQPGGEGVGAIVTKLYPGARTYTSNARTNSDGTLYRAKGEYEGARVEVISIPKLNQLHVNPHSVIQILVEQETSGDEVDDRNIAEEKIFNFSPALLSWRGLERRQFLLDLLRVGKLDLRGNLSYVVNAIELGAEKFTPTKPVQFQTSFFQNSVQTNITEEGRKEAREFLEAKFPKGYKGSVNLVVEGSATPITLTLGLHTFPTAKAAGMKIINNASVELAREVLQRFQATQQ